MAAPPRLPAASIDAVLATTARCEAVAATVPHRLHDACHLSCLAIATFRHSARAMLDMRVWAGLAVRPPPIPDELGRRLRWGVDGGVTVDAEDLPDGGFTCVEVSRGP